MKKHLSVYVIGFFGLIMAGLTYGYLERQEHDHLREKLNRHTQRYTNSFKTILQSEAARTTALQSLFHSSREVTRAEFQKFARSEFGERSHVNTVLWAPRIRNNEIDAFTRRVRKKPWGESFSVQDVTVQRVPEGKSNFVYPVLYVHPPGKNETWWGQTLLSIKPFRTAMEIAMNRSGMAMSEPRKINPGSGSEFTFSMIQPVYDRHPNRSEPESDASVEGFIVGEFRGDRLMRSVREVANTMDVNVHVWWEHENHQHHFYSTENTETSSPKPKQILQQDFNYLSERNVQIVGEPFKVLAHPTDSFLARHSTFFPEASAAMVFLLMLFLCVYIYRFQQRREIIEQNVRERTSELEEARQEIEEANQTQNQLLSRVGNDIRSPLNAIGGMVDVLRQSNLTSKQREVLDSISSATRALKNLLNDVVDLARIDSGDLILEREPIELEEFVVNSVSYHARQAHRKELNFALNIDPDCPAFVLGDPRRLQQIIVNLLSTAVEISEEGDIVFRVTPLDVSDRKTKLAILITATDPERTGEKLDDLFRSPHTSVDSVVADDTAVEPGLIITRKLVERMDGDLSVHTSENQETTFRLELPFSIPDEEERARSIANVARSETLPVDLNNRSILLVMNNPVNRKYISGMLETWGAGVTTAGSGQGALDLIENREESFSLILVDRYMPDMDGVEFLEVLRRRGYDESVIMMVPSGDLAREQNHLKGRNISTVLQKPVDRAMLLQSLVKALGEEYHERIAHRRAETEPPELDLPVERSTLNILFAEDNRANRKLIGSFLQNQPVQIDFARTGKQAIDLYKSREYDVVFMDLRMPETSGVQATIDIRDYEREWNTSRTPIVALIQQELEEHKHRCLEAGCDGYLTKPIGENDLIKTIQQFAVDREFHIPTTERSSGEEEDEASPVKSPPPEFIEDIQEKLQVVRESLDREAFRRGRDAAHRIRVTAGLLGLVELEDTASKLEEAFVQEDRNEVKERISTIESLLEKLLNKDE